MDQALQSLRTRCIDHVIEIEGGFVDDPSDSGGATCYGITETVARAAGHDGRMADLPLALAREIYIDRYWTPLRLDEIFERVEGAHLARELFDTGVNCGVGVAGQFLQRSLNVLNDRGRLYDDVAVDGLVGANTIGALSSLVAHRGTAETDRLLAHMCNCLQGARYVELAERREKDERFLHGWMLRRTMTEP